MNRRRSLRRSAARTAPSASSADAPALPNGAAAPPVSYPRPSVTSSGQEPPEQLVLDVCELFFGQLAALVRGFRLQQLLLDDCGIVHLPLGLLEQDLGDPDRPAHRRERQRHEGRQDSHAPRSNVAKADGGSGPTTSI